MSSRNARICAGESAKRSGNVSGVNAGARRTGHGAGADSTLGEATAGGLTTGVGEACGSDLGDGAGRRGGGRWRDHAAIKTQAMRRPRGSSFMGARVSRRSHRRLRNLSLPQRSYTAVDELSVVGRGNQAETIVVGERRVRRVGRHRTHRICGRVTRALE